MANKRIHTLNNKKESKGSCIVYVMMRDQRVQDNHALLTAQQHALKQKLPLFVLFNLIPRVGVRSREHYEFMLGGLCEIKKTLKKLNIPMILQKGDYNKTLQAFTQAIQPAALYFDFSPLRFPTKLRESIANSVHIPCFSVDTHNIVPAWKISTKQEYAAHTFRRKIHATLRQYIKEPVHIIPHPYTYTGKPVKTLTFNEYKHTMRTIPTSGITVTVKPGQSDAKKHLKAFITNTLKIYAKERNDPTKNALSNLSPYLHFGHISSLRVALEVLNAVNKTPLLYKKPKMPEKSETSSEEDGMNVLFEEMIVRKELSDNFCLYNKQYDSLSGAHEWAKKTLKKHRKDKREYIYTKNAWEQAKTHDPAWNATQNELRKTGKIHGYMRMYWAKKLLEWSESPKKALDIGIYLNDHYSIDGGDPNGYVGLLWSIAGLHDRPWAERPVYGTIRYMNYEGLKRKFDIKHYIKTWNG